jgi:hypothetical protein
VKECSGQRGKSPVTNNTINIFTITKDDLTPTEMKYTFLILLFTVIFQVNLKSQNLLKLSAEVISAANDLQNSLSDLQKMKNAIKDIEEKKAPNISQNEWGELANKYRKAGQVIDKAPLPTEFDSKEFAVSLDDMKNCKLKERNLKKMDGYLIELKEGQERGRESIIKLNKIAAKIKVSKELLRYCIDVHEKLILLPIFGQKFAWDWVELEIDVTDALNVFEESIKN